MSFKRKILGESLSDKIIGTGAESDALATGDGGSFYDRTQSQHPQAVMVRPVNATWDYNPVPVRPDINHGEVGGERIADDDVSPSDGEYMLPTEDLDARVDVLIEDIDSVLEELFD